MRKTKQEVICNYFLDDKLIKSTKQQRIVYSDQTGNWVIVQKRKIYLQDMFNGATNVYEIRARTISKTFIGSHP